MSAESHSEPCTMTDVSDCKLVLVDESTAKPTSFLFDYSLPTGNQTSAENSPSDKDDTLSDCDEDSQEIEPEKILEPTTNQRLRSDAQYLLRRCVQPPSQLMCMNLCTSSGQASPKGGSDVTVIIWTTESALCVC